MHLPVIEQNDHLNHSCAQDLLGGGNLDTSVVWLNKFGEDLSTLNKESVTLATVVAKDCLAVEVEAECLGEGSGWVGDEADAALSLWVKGLTPCLGDKWVVDSNDEDLSSLVKLWALHVAWDVRVGASWAEGGWDTNDQGLASTNLLSEVDLVSWGSLSEAVEIWDLVANADECWTGSGEATGCSAGANGCETADGEGVHDSGCEKVNSEKVVQLRSGPLTDSMQSKKITPRC